MRRKFNDDALIYAAVSFMLPVLILLFMISRASVNIINGVELQMNDIDEMRSKLALGPVFIPDVLCDVLTRRFYPSFILSLIIGGAPGKFLLRGFFYIRFGLMSLGMYHWSVRHVRIERIHAVLIGLIYSFCAVSFTASLMPQVSNVMIVMPLALSAADTLLRRGFHKDVWIAAAVFALFGTGGFEGIITGLLFTVCVLWILSQLINGARIGAAVKACFLSVIFELPVLIPVFASGRMFIDIKTETLNSRVTFTLFDMLCSGLDGTPINIPEAGSYAVFGVSMFVAVMAVLFFINQNVPHGAKLAGFITLVVTAASLSWSLLSAVLSVYEDMDAGAFMRTGMLCVITFFLATISWRNAGNVSRTGIYGAAAAVFAFIVIANSSSSGEVSKSVFSIWFSAGAVLFWTIVLLMQSEGREKAVKWFAFLGIIGVTVNLFYCFKVSEFAGLICESRPYGGRDSTLSVEVGDDFPLYGSDPEYLLVYSDLRTSSADTYPERVNILTQAALLGDLFEKADSFTVFSSGVTVEGNGVYFVSERDVPYEVLVRCENMNPGDSYYVYTTFDDSAVLSENYGDDEIITELEGPFVKVLERQTDGVSLRLVGTTSSDSEMFTVWRADSAVMEELRGTVRSLEGFEALIGGDPDSAYASYMTVITSVPYGDNYDIRITGPDGRVSSETFGFAGRLAAVFQGVGSEDYMVKVTNSAAVPVVSLVLWVLSLGVILYNVFIHKETVRKEPNAQQEN